MIKETVIKPRSGNKIKVYHTLKNSIQFLEIKPGTQIVESELEESLGVSRTPIREALMRLSDEKLVEIYPQRGTYVTKINLSLSKEMAYMRHVLETEILMDLCNKKLDLRDTVEDKMYLMKLALKRQEPIEYIRQDAEFHKALFIKANRGIIWNTIANTRAHYVRTLVLDMSLPYSLRKSFESHCLIIECIKTGDSKKLAEVLDEHHDYKLSQTDKELVLKYPDYFID